MMLSIFNMFISHLDDFFGEMLAYFFFLILTGLVDFLVLSCMCYLYILEISPLSVVSFAVIFSHPEGCFFTLFSFLCCAKAFRFN